MTRLVVATPMDTPQRPADAAEIKVIASNGARGALVELGRQFQDTAATSWRWISTSSLPLKRRIDAGETFDLVILSPRRSTI